MEKTSFNLDDISKETARQAYYWNSFDPDKRGEGERQSYVEEANKMLEIVEKYAITDLQKEKAEEFLVGYKTRLLSKWNAYLSAHGKTASSMVTGPANFPTRRNQKALRTEHKRSTELIDFINDSKSRLVKLIESCKPADVVLDEAQQSIRKQVAKITSFLQDSGFYNSALLRSNFRGRITTIAKNNPELVDFIIAEIRSSPVKIFTDTNKFWGELESLKVKQEEPAKENKIIEVNGIEIIINYDIDRIQIAFKGKPERNVIDQLKHKAFHWSPSTMTWMRKMTQQAFLAAKEICQGV